MLDLDPEMEAQQAFQQAVQNLLAESEALASAGDIEQAQAKFLEARDLDPNLGLDTQAETQRLIRLAGARLVAEGIELAGAGNIQAGPAKIEEAKTLSENFKVSPETWHTLCVKGGQFDVIAAGLALDACNRAVELDEDNGLTYNSRGIVHLKLGQEAEATEDFKMFERWLEESGSIR